MTVVAFKGMTAPGEPVPEIVEMLEELLERAKAGDVRALAYATVESDMAFTDSWWAENGTGFQLAAAAGVLHWKALGSLAQMGEEQ